MERFFEHMRSCANCGFSFIKPEVLLCKKCEEICNKAQAAKAFDRMSSLGKVSGYALWNWHPGSNDALSALLSTLKGGVQKKAFQYYAEQLLQKRLALGEKWEGDIIFVPAPASTIGIKDHAWFLTQALSEIAGAPSLEIFVKRKPGHQRGLGLGERQKISIEIRENFTREGLSRELSGKSFIFVDDVVTTGATALAALSILPNFKNFEVWCLAQRETCYV